MLQRFERDVVQHRPTWVTISAGMNEAALGLPLAEYQGPMTALVDAAKSAQLKVGLCTPTVFEADWVPAAMQRGNGLLQEYNAWLCSVARGRGLLVIPMFEAFQRARQGADAESNLRFTHDGVHMAPAGRYLMGLTFLAAFVISLPTESGEGSEAS
jgi:lysophospholipase L1-like esterase